MSQRKPWKQLPGTPQYVRDGRVTIASCWDKDTADQIIREHNAHDDLLEACEAAVGLLEPDFATFRQVQAAIANAKEVKPL